MRTQFITLLLFFLGWTSLSAQSPLDRTVSISFVQQNLDEALFQLMVDEEIPLLFHNGILPVKPIHLRFQKEKVSRVLDVLLEDTGVEYAWNGRQVVLTERKSIPQPATYTVSGYIEAAGSGERLSETTVYSPSADRGVFSNEFGFFSLTLPAGHHELLISYLGFRPRQLSVDLMADTVLLINLAADLTLRPVTVTASDSSFLRRPLDFSADELIPSEGESLPRLGGEYDLMRLVHLLPGVQTGADGIGGIFVRGGNAGHNLVIIDDVPIYNVNHAGGLLSVFNTSTIKSVRLMKGAIPARYGGRLSSVMDVRTRDGNKVDWQGEASLGLLSSNLTLEGPIVRGKSSVLISGRGSLLNLYLRPGMRTYKARRGENGSTEYGFYDLTAKVSHTFSETDKIYLSYYQGRDDFSNFGQRTDVFGLTDIQGNNYGFRLKQSYDEHFDWGNRAWSLRWNHLLNPQLFLNTTVTYSQMDVNINYSDRDTLEIYQPAPVLSTSLTAGEYHSDVREGGVQFDFHWAPNARNEVRFGAQFKKSLFQPGVIRFTNQSLENQDFPTIHRNEHDVSAQNLYIENRQQLGDQLILNYGLRLGGFRTGSTNYWALQPRFSATWLASKKLMLRASVSKNNQFVHLLSNNAIGLPTDLWVPSTEDIQPQKAWQVTLGGDIRLGDAWSFSMEGYAKRMDQLLSYSEGITFVDDWENNVTQGEGEAFGIDIMLRKQRGKTKGWLSYSLAWANRSFDRINFGDVYPFKYDRRHDIKLVLIQEINDHWEFSGSWIFGTGLAFSLPLEQFEVSFPGVPELPIVGVDYGAKNQYRLPYYHRLDFSINYRSFANNGLEHRFQAGVYNAYNRNNPLYYKFDRSLVVSDNELVEQREFVGVRLLPILPSLSYSLRF